MSRAIDLPNGGKNTIRSNTLEKGPHPEMNEVVCVGCEIAAPPNGAPGRTLETIFQANTVVCDGARQPYGCDVYRDMGGKAVLQDNTLVGPHKLVSDKTSGSVTVGANREFPDRAAAGMPPYPGL